MKPLYFIIEKEQINIATRTKFNVDKNISKRTYNGITFDSIQKPYELQPKFIHNGKTVQSIKYVADFFITYKDGHEEVVDTKGYPDSVALLKRKLFWYHYPTIDYKWVTWVKKFGGWIKYEDYKKFKREEKQKVKYQA